MMKQKVEYIHYNPVRRGYVDDPEVWRYSSARSYSGKKSLIEVNMDW
jgi:putative transposase